MKATCILFEGPHATTDHDWEERPEWCAFPADDDGEECGSVQFFSSFETGYQWAQAEAKRQHLEFVNEATTA